MEETNGSSWIYSDDAEELFVKEVNSQFEKTGLDKKSVTYNRKGCGLLEFYYKQSFIGKIKLGKRTSFMDVVTVTIKPEGNVLMPYFQVDKIKNKSLETYTKLIGKWADAYIALESTKDDIDRLFENNQ